MQDADAIHRALEAKAGALRDDLLGEVAANLSGRVLQQRSGVLKSSIVAEVQAGIDTLSVSVASVGVPYAAIQEYGGTTPPHDFVPVKARALAFAGADGRAFARRVHHPGSRIPARPFLGAALDALHDDIVLGLKDAILVALHAG